MEKKNTLNDIILHWNDKPVLCPTCFAGLDQDKYPIVSNMDQIKQTQKDHNNSYALNLCNYCREETYKKIRQYEKDVYNRFK